MLSPDALIRVTYASRATFKPFHSTDQDDSVMNDILHSSRLNNNKNNLVGVLYYGNGCFFQCLEGHRADVNRLLQVLTGDTRHNQLKMLSSEHISERMFQDWHMKYATVDQDVRQFLRQYNLVKFEPHQFDPIMMQDFLKILKRAGCR